MELNTEQLEILFRARMLATEGRGQVLEDWALEDARELEEHGWLTSHKLDNGDTAWFCAPTGETALNINTHRAVSGVAGVP
jgi:hypothetical protein